MVVAAAGNVHPLVCPACFTRTVGVAFHRESTTVTSDGRVVKGQLPATGRGNLLQAEVTVAEPPGFDGTSFAAPLLSGFAALTTSPHDVEALARSGTALTPVLQLAQLHAQCSERGGARAIATLHQGMLAFAEGIPAGHRHWERAIVSQTCPECALFLIDWYNALVSLLMATGVPEQAVPIARIAAVLAPFSPSVAGNLGEGLRRWALGEPQESPRRGEHFREAALAFERAVQLSPVSLFVSRLHEVRAELAR